jgi:transposase-like protein
MPLSNELRNQLFELRCPSCSHPTLRKGSWVITVRNFKCDGCGAKVRIGYPEKLKIFERRLREAVNSSPSQMQSADEPKPV